MMNIMNPPADWSTLKKLIWLRGTPITGGEELTVSGTPPLSLPNSLGKPLKAWAVEVSPYQEGTGDPAPDNVRPIHGTDKLTIYTDSKYGGLVEWNQLLQNGNFANGTTGWTIGAEWKSREAVDNVLHLVSTQNQYPYINISHSYPNIVGHKYFGSLRIKASKASRVDMTIGATAGHGIIIKGVSYNADTWNLISGIGSPDAYTSDVLYIRPKSSIDAEEVDIYITDIFCCDLTAMFGAGNEPSTVEEFRALFPKDYYPYNAGQQMTVDQVNGAQYTPAVLTLPSTVYTGTIGSEGGESRSAKYVFTGNETWGYFGGENTFFYVTIPELAQPDTSTWLDATTENGLILRINTAGGQLRCYMSSNPFLTEESDMHDYAYSGIGFIYSLITPQTFTLPTPTIPTPTGTATTWATAEDGTVESMSVTYVGKA